MGALLLWVAVALVCCSNALLVPGWRSSTGRRTALYSDSGGARPVTEDETNLKNFIQGTTPWKGTRDILKRKKQVPSDQYVPQEVVQKVLDALQICDDPQLDHGPCVLLEFKSPKGPLATSNLDPAVYGRFLRSTEYGLLIDHTMANLMGEPEELQDSLSVKQKVRVSGYGDSGMGALKTLDFDFYLSLVDSCWLIDVVLLSK
ncbi:hypothetical protein B484DRAFT_445470 [Ochromonadaceae sp. CCMP2298]|nr:hypothetical protein B484DRAFT_445470 [Ochromonadaceae sp. CCMP2298]